MIPCRSRAGIRNSAGEKSPTVRLQMSRPSDARARTSAAILRISDPTSDPASAEGRDAVRSDCGARAEEDMGGRYLRSRATAARGTSRGPLQYVVLRIRYLDWHIGPANSGPVRR